MYARLHAVLVLGTLAGCTGAPPACRVGADCASGRCLADGTCAASTEPTTGIDGAVHRAADAGREDAFVLRADAADGTCTPTHDGILARAEVPLAADLAATFRVAQDAVVDTHGEINPDGTRHWDLSGALAGDEDRRMGTAPVAGAWYAADFVGATYASPLSASSDLLGVFEATGDALLLRGVVSPEDGLTRTELTYDPPVTVLAFPLAAEASFATETTVSGQALGLFVLYDETYAEVVDAVGDLATPFGTFPVLRLQVTLVRTVGLVTTTIRSYVFLAECFGPVATIVAGNNDPEVEPTKAAEVRRLAP